MSEAVSLPDFNSPIVSHARKDFPLLYAGMTVDAALERIRREGVGERVIYFFATDARDALVGVLPTRRLLTARFRRGWRKSWYVGSWRFRRSATVLEACEFFVLYKFFAFPVVDRARRVVGVVDVSLFAEEMLEAGDREAVRPTVARSVGGEDVFEALGFRLAQIRGASPWRVFRYRFPWWLRRSEPAQLARSWRVRLKRRSPAAWSWHFFLRWCSGFNESVSMQTMSSRFMRCADQLTRVGFLGNCVGRLCNIALLGVSCGFLSASSFGCGAMICRGQLSAAALRSRW